MATQSITHQVGVAIPQENTEDRTTKFRELLSTIVDLAGVYFGAGASIGHLESDYRDNLSAKEKAMIDANMNGLWMP